MKMVDDKILDSHFEILKYYDILSEKEKKLYYLLVGTLYHDVYVILNILKRNKKSKEIA
jgi:hypothetical protein